MKRTVFILLLGLVCGASAHLGWYAWQRPPASNDLESQLVWMQDNLHLTPAQLAGFKALHEQSAPRLLQLAAQVGRMRGEFAAFERTRQTAGQVDFIEFARFVDERRRLDRECADSTRQLVDASANLMTPQQREHYFLLLGSARKTSSDGLVN